MVRQGKTEKISVTLPRGLAAEIRGLVSQGEVSSFFAEALQHYIALHRQKKAMQMGFGAWKKEAHPDLATPADSTTYIRSIREADAKRLTRLGDRDAR